MSSTLNFDVRFSKYLSDVEKANSEDAKAFFFLEFARDVFSGIALDHLGNLYPVLQKYLRRKSGLGLVGRPDALLGNLLIEFKTDLKTKLQEAESQLKVYTAILWSNQGNKRVSYLAMASDGLRFVIYKPFSSKKPGQIVDPSDVELVKLDEADLSLLRSNPDRAFVWLDRYILYKSKIPPTGEAFAERFGHESPSYKEAMLILNKAWSSAKTSVQTVYEEWGRYLRYVYGSEVASEELFLKHTYLATLAKLLVYLYYSSGKFPTRDELLGILKGLAFKQWHIHNFLEEDFFSWLGRKEVEEEGVAICNLLLDVLLTFDLTLIDEDVLKALYQELVDPAERHDLGEYYTPDWLAEYIVDKVLKVGGKQSVLDPACGSGTFLVAALRCKQKMLKSVPPQELLNHLAESVAGIDIHPLAVIVSKVNYLLAIRGLLKQRPGAFTLPVYMANSIIPPSQDPVLIGGLQTYSVKVDLGKKEVFLQIPAVVAEDAELIDPAISAIRSYAESLVQGQSPDKTVFQNQLEQVAPCVARLSQRDAVVDILFHSSLAMKDIIEAGKDTIWSFILRNVYRPLFISKKKFDVVVGNPPWLSFRYVEDVKYQNDLKSLMQKYGVLTEAKLITQMELATLFLLRVSDLYLKPDGVISFVMPRSVFVADQHDSFRRRVKGVGIIHIADFEGVYPLFNVPCCVITAKKGGVTSYPIEGVVAEGELPRKNAKLVEAIKALKIRKTRFVLCEVGRRSFLAEGDVSLKFAGRSAYYKDFTQGATIVPRACWFVDLKPHPALGFDPNYPFVESSEKAISLAKDAYEGLRLEGNVEACFLYAVVTGSELAPFCCLPLPIAVLPIEPSGKGFRIVRREEAERRGYSGLLAWLQRVEKVWEEKRAEKAKKMDIYQRLDYSHTLTQQNPLAKYKVVYNTSGTNLTACVILQKDLVKNVNEQTVKLEGLVAEATVYHYETDDLDEAYYLAAILNSPFLDKMVKPLQARGLWGERHFHKKPLEFPIPRYNPKDKHHQALSNLGKSCAKEASKILPTLLQKYTSVGKIRSEIRKLIKRKLNKIDTLVATLLKNNKSGLENFINST